MPQTRDLPAAMQGLAALGARGDVEIRPVLLRVLTDLFVSRGAHSREEHRQYEAIALGLIDKADAQTRLIVAAKLARFGATPAAVVDRILDMGGEPALEFFRYSGQAPRARLLSAAREGTLEQAEAVARRVDLDEEAVRALAARPEIEVARALVDNPLSPIPDDAAAGLVACGRRDAALGQALCRRYTDPVLTAPLYARASPAHRAAILLASRRADLGDPTRPPRDFGERLNSEEIERAATLRDRPLLIALLARALGASLTQAEEILGDPRGEPLALALAALRVPGEAAARIFMCLDPVIAHSHERVRALSELVVDAPPRAARAIVNAMLGKETKPLRPKHAPVADASASETPSRPASNARAAAPQTARRPILLLRRKI